MRVRLPNGKMAEFPDTMSEEEIKGVLAKKFPVSQPEHDSPSGPEGDVPSLITRGASAGFGDYVGAAGRYLGSRLLNPARTIQRSLEAQGQRVPEQMRVNGPEPLSFNDALKGVRGGVKQAQKENPYVAYPAELAGAITSPAYKGAANLAGRAVSGMGTLSRIGRYGAQGAGAGVLAGAGYAQDEEGGLPSPTDLALSTGMGGAIGGSLGLVLGAGAEGIQKGVSSAKNFLGRYMPSKQPDVAAEALRKAIERDNLNPGLVKARLNKLGPEAVPADVGPNVRALGEYVAQSPGKGMAQAERTLLERQSGRGTRLFKAVQSAFGKDKFHKSLDDLFAARAKAADVPYEKAFKYKLPNDLRLKRFLKDPKVRSGIRRGLDIIRREKLARDQVFDPSDYGVAFEGENIVLKGGERNVRLWDAAKRGMDDILEEYRDKATGVKRLDQSGRALQELKDAMVTRIDDLTTVDGTSLYKTARDAWAGPSSIMDAMGRGRRFMSQDAEITEKMIAKMTQSEKEGFRIGVAQKLRDIIDNTPDGSNAAKRIFNKSAVRNKLRAAFPDSRSWNQFKRVMLSEIRMGETETQALRNSATARRLSVKEDVESELPMALAETVAGRPNYAIASTGRNILQKLGQSPEGLRFAIAQDVFAKGPQAQQNTMSRLFSSQIKRQLTEAERRAISDYIARTSGGLAGRGAR